MFRFTRVLLLSASAIGMTLSAGKASAGEYRLYFQGSQTIAAQSSAAPLLPGPPPAAGPAVVAAPAPPPAAVSLSVPAAACANCPTQPNHGAGTPNQIVTFLHPFTCQAVTVPLTLPVGKPNVVIGTDRVVYRYGLFKRVIVHFLPNGQVEVIYRS